MILHICDIPLDKLPFHLGGMCLQEPTALLSNLLIAVVAFSIYKKIVEYSHFHEYWKKFYLFLGIGVFLGGLSHVFYVYTGVYGKFPSWIFASIAALYVSKAMIDLPILSHKIYRISLVLIYLKFFTFLSLSLYTKSFMFITVDSIFTYLLFCMGFGFYYWKKGLDSFKYTVIAVLVLVPSVFIFIFKISPSIWFTSNDISHVLIAITIILFYVGLSRSNEIDFKYNTIN